MERVRKKRNRGFTLIEVMVSMIVILIIVIGVVHYMYGSMWNAKRADVRITAHRIGQILLETWKITGHFYLDEFGNQKWTWSVSDFDPTVLTLPVTFNPADFDLSGKGIDGTELDDYTITIDGVVYFITLLFDNHQPQMLSARVAWNLNYSSPTLKSNFQYIDVTSYAIN